MERFQEAVLRKKAAQEEEKLMAELEKRRTQIEEEERLKNQKEKPIVKVPKIWSTCKFG